MIKIYGESKTGTTYLQKLLEANDIEVYGGSDWNPLGWKHGFPQAGECEYIFIFRGIYGWAKSQKSSKIDKRFNGLQETFGSHDYNFWQCWDNPIRCRTVKYYSYLGFSKLYPAHLVNLEWLRDNAGEFVSHFKETDLFQDLRKHTYINANGRDNPNKKEITAGELDFIDQHKDPKLELLIEQMTWTKPAYIN